MRVWREGRLIDGRAGTGDILALEIDTHDARALLDPGKGLVTDRFQGMRNFVTGWAPEDKVIIDLQPDPDNERGIANLALDPGGDVHLTLWDNKALRRAGPCEVFPDLKDFVTLDLNDVLARVGITAVVICDLPLLENAREELAFRAS